MEILSYQSFKQLLDEAHECRVWQYANAFVYSGVRVIKVAAVYVVMYQHLDDEGNVTQEIVEKRYSPVTAYKAAISLIPE